MKRNLLRAVARTATGAVLVVAAMGAWAQQYPVKTVRIVVTLGPGSAGDLLTRLLAEPLGRSLGQTVIADNRPGAGGNLAAEIVAKAPPDGYTLFLTTISTHGINPTLYSKLPFDPVRDFAPITMISYSPHVLGVHPSLPVTSVRELIDFAKANPGKLNFAVSGTGGAPHLAGIEFAQRTGISWAYIPYKGGSAAVADVAGGQANVIMNGMLATYPTVKSGRIRGLAVASAQKVAAAPELPTLAETLPGFETGSYQGILAPAGTPADVVAKLNAELARILATADMKERLASQGTEVRSGPPAALGSFIASERTRWARVIKESGIKFD